MPPTRMLLVTALSFTTALVARAQLPDAVIPSGFGVNIHFTREEPGEVAQIAATGVKFVRMDYSWVDVETQKGVYDFSGYDRLLDTLELHGLRAVLIVDYAHPLYDDNRSPDTDEGRAAFARFAAAGAERYRGRGVIWEIYNEPNIFPFWRPKPNWPDYIKLAQVTAEAIRTADPNATIIGPASAGIDLDFLELCLKGGLLGHFDGVSVHPYTQRGPETNRDGYRRLRGLIERHGADAAQRARPILSGEWGYSDIWAGLDRRRQAAMLARQWLFNSSQGVNLSIWYDWRDDGLKPDEPEHHFGLVEHTALPDPKQPFLPKPAYAAAKTLIDTLRGQQFARRLATDLDEDWVLLFARKTEDGAIADARVAAWTTAGRTRRIGLPASDGTFDVVNLLGVRQEAIEARNGQVWIDLSEEPVYLVPQAPNDLLRLAAAWRGPAEVPVRLDRAHGTTTWTASVRNPLAEPVGVQVGLTAPAADALESTHRVLQPGEQKEFTIELPVARRPGVQPAQVYLSMAGQAVPVAAAIELVCVNPIEVAIQPINRSAAWLSVAAPAGERWTGTIDVIDATSDTPRTIEAAVEADAPFGTLLRLGDPVPNPAQVGVHLREPAASPATPGDGSPDAILAWREILGLNASEWQTAVEGDEKIPAEHRVSFGKASPVPGDLKVPVATIDYAFEPGWRYVMLQSKGFAPTLNRPGRLGLWVEGDASGNILRCRFTDSAGQTFQPDGPKLNFTGWRYIEFPLDGLRAGHWGGDKSGVVKFPIRLDTLVLIDSAARQKTGGTVRVAGPTLIEQ